MRPLPETNRLIFLSYRHKDASGTAGRIYDHLSGIFGRDSIFFDVSSLSPGSELSTRIPETISKTKAFLCVIGPNWLTELQARIHSEDVSPFQDYVELELKAALELGIKIFPVLVDGAAMPKAHDLPNSISALSRVLATTVRHDSFHGDTFALANSLRDHLFSTNLLPPLFDILQPVISSALADLTPDEALSFLGAILASEHATHFARERLRPQFQSHIPFATFDHVIENFRITQQDLIDFFATKIESPVLALSYFIYERIRLRSTDWTESFSSGNTYTELLSQYYFHYEQFFIHHDPDLRTIPPLLHSIGATTLRNHLQSVLTKLSSRRGASPSLNENLPNELLAVLSSFYIPYEILERSAKSIDLAISDISGLMPSIILVIGLSGDLSSEVIDSVVDRSKQTSHSFNQIIVVTFLNIEEQLRTYALRRRIQILSIDDLREKIRSIQGGFRFTIGTSAIRQLIHRHVIEKTFIDPHCAEALPGMPIDYEIRERKSALNYVSVYLQDTKNQLLLILGNYGAGKSAFCAKIAQFYSENDSSFQPVFIELNSIADGEKLPELVEKAIQVSLLRSSKTPIVILDGLDEIGNAMNPIERRKNILRLREVMSDRCKLIVTARATYFRGLRDFWNLVAPNDKDGLLQEFSRRLGRRKPTLSVQAIFLHDFNTDQVAEFFEKYAYEEENGREFLNQFIGDLEDKDPNQVYRFLGRSPLFLYLLVSTQPWNNSSVRCTADILRTFIQFWLERDMEKGLSRWALSHLDRLDFCDKFAWHLFTTRQLSLSYSSFEDFVANYYKLNGEDLSRLVIDLQTTGMFATRGSDVHFAFPTFQDFFVAKQFAEASFAVRPERIPTKSQAFLWLGLLLTDQTNLQAWNHDSALSSWAKCFANLKPQFVVILRGILCHRGAPEVWSKVALDHKSQARIITASLEQVPDETDNLARVKVGNRYGLHARPCAYLAGCFDANGFANIDITAEIDGDEVDALSVCGLMMLAAHHGAIVNFRSSLGKQRILRALESLGIDWNDSNEKFDAILHFNEVGGG